MAEGKHADLTEKIIGAFYKVYNTLGYGFSEKVYENALAHELRKLGLKVEQQARILVYFGPKADIKRKVYDNERKGSLAWTQSEKSV